MTGSSEVIPPDWSDYRRCEAALHLYGLRVNRPFALVWMLKAVRSLHIKRYIYQVMRIIESESGTKFWCAIAVGCVPLL